MKIIFVWTGVTGYMGDCWRALQQIPGVCLKVFIEEKRETDTSFNHLEAFHGLDVILAYENDPLDQVVIRREVSAFAPDVIFVVGWRARLSRFFALEKQVESIPKVLIFDLPFEWTIRKLLAPVILGPYLRRFQKAFVPGAKASTYARWLGFKENQIEKGLFCTDIQRFKNTFNKRALLSLYPRRFFYVGRYAPEKRLDLIADAYKHYRTCVANPWPLTCVGTGSDRKYLCGCEGIQDLGFKQPSELADIFQEHGAFLFLSDFEPWGGVLEEACAAGLPIICTEACGAQEALVKDNGIVCPVGDRQAIANAMVQLHNVSDDRLREMGKRGLELVAPYSCEAWSERVIGICKQSLHGFC